MIFLFLMRKNTQQINMFKRLLLEIKEVFDKKNIDKFKDVWYIKIQNKLDNLT